MTQDERVEAYRVLDKQYHPLRTEHLKARQRRDWQAASRWANAKSAITQEMHALADGCEHTYRGKSIIEPCHTSQGQGQCEVCRNWFPV